MSWRTRVSSVVGSAALVVLVAASASAQRGAARRQGLTLLQRMLYPSQAGRGGDPSRVPQTVTVTLRSGQIVTGRLAYRDEFTIALTDADGWHRSWPASQVTFAV